mmetsp:Transcript_113634/g.226123  ORF Transcript_113634/g.226123 Transcript_113634/m.226123 type:complete len:86 (-) Transcript_113634:339-596(-)
MKQMVLDWTASLRDWFAYARWLWLPVAAIQLRVWPLAAFGCKKNARTAIGYQWQFDTGTPSPQQDANVAVSADNMMRWLQKRQPL